MEIVWWAVSIGSFVFYICFVQVFLPKIFFNIKFDINSLRDRGIVNFKEKDGRSIIYEPKVEYRKYIERYVLSNRKNKIRFLCKIEDKISSIDYDVILFDNKCKRFSIINARENIKRPGFTREMYLPLKTAFVSVIVNSVDGDDLEHASKYKRNLSRRTKFSAVIISVLSIIEVFFIKYALGQIYGDVFAQEFMTSVFSIIITSVLAILTALANFGFIVLHFRKKERRGGAYGQ